MDKRRTSVTAQLSRTARRFSAAIAPQLTKIDPIPILQKLTQLEIKLTDIRQLQSAVEQYVMHNAVMFQPIEFDIVDEDGYRALQATLYPEEMVLSEGARRLLSITLGDDDDDASSSIVAKIKHPVSGIRVFELIAIGSQIQVMECGEELPRWNIIVETPTCASLLTLCGCLFTKESWTLVQQDKRLAFVHPQRSFFSENAVTVKWDAAVDNDVRVLALSFGLMQMIREAFPSLVHILKEHRARRHQ